MLQATNNTLHMQNYYVTSKYRHTVAAVPRWEPKTVNMHNCAVQ
jgi:hypothetical protein